MDMQENQTPFDYVRQPFVRLVKNDAAIGILLFLSALAAMIVANSSWGAEWYHHLWEKELTLQYEQNTLTLDLHHFINDGLMAIFFFLVGLEIKREFLAGELSEWKQAVLPIGAALGGIIFPAAIYLLITTPDVSQGWGIPMATDIAFTLGLISFVRNRVPMAVKVFVTSLAVVDDIGAVLVIAIFYTSSLDTHQLIIAGGAWLLLMGANRLGVRSVFFYSFVGITVIWISFFYSGIHPTIAGILLAFTIPAKTRISKDQFTDRLKRLYRKYLKSETYNMAFNTGREEKMLKGIRAASDDARTPLQKIETSLHPLVYYVIMPLFAFANAGLTIGDNFFSVLLSPVSMGIILGLLLGKFIGISVFSRILVALGFAKLPKGGTWRQVYGVSILAGIGFTMSLFISELAFDSKENVEAAKSAILVASLLAAFIGLLVIRYTNPKIEVI